jgi:hypothetical protein
MQSANVADALDAFFRYCRRASPALPHHPDLAATYRETVSGCSSPLLVTVRRDACSSDDRVSLTSTLFEAGQPSHLLSHGLSGLAALDRDRA